jgi:hypothetical protein
MTQQAEKLVKAHIVNLKNFTPEDVDLELVEAKLWNIRRFNGHPEALMVRQHTHLVEELAAHDGATPEVVEWCRHHDDHEGIIGDVIGPVETIIREHTPVLDYLKNHLDVCICGARGINYPSVVTKKATHFYDKLAESLEWQFGLGYDDAGFHPDWPSWIASNRHYARDLFERARDRARP